MSLRINGVDVVPMVIVGVETVTGGKVKVVAAEIGKPVTIAARNVMLRRGPTLFIPAWLDRAIFAKYRTKGGAHGSGAAGSACGALQPHHGSGGRA
jgi:hypothetical protein